MHTMCRGRLQKQPHIGAQSVRRPSKFRGRGVEVGLPTLFTYGCIASCSFLISSKHSPAVQNWFVGVRIAL